jgi:hypothetical protein
MIPGASVGRSNGWGAPMFQYHQFLWCNDNPHLIKHNPKNFHQLKKVVSV